MAWIICLGFLEKGSSLDMYETYLYTVVEGDVFVSYNGHGGQVGLTVTSLE